MFFLCFARSHLWRQVAAATVRPTLPCGRASVVHTAFNGAVELSELNLILIFRTGAAILPALQRCVFARQVVGEE